jgi:hypothetical protein
MRVLPDPVSAGAVPSDSRVCHYMERLERETARLRPQVERAEKPLPLEYMMAEMME